MLYGVDGMEEEGDYGEEYGEGYEEEMGVPEEGEYGEEEQAAQQNAYQYQEAVEEVCTDEEQTSSDDGAEDDGVQPQNQSGDTRSFEGGQNKQIQSQQQVHEQYHSEGEGLDEAEGRDLAPSNANEDGWIDGDNQEL